MWLTALIGAATRLILDYSTSGYGRRCGYGCHGTIPQTVSQDFSERALGVGIHSWSWAVYNDLRR